MKAGGVGYGIRDDVSGVAGNAACAVAKVAGHVRTPLPPERKSSRAVSRRSWHAGQLKPLPCKNLLGIAPFLQAAAVFGLSAAYTFRFMTADSFPFRVALMQHGVSEAALAPLTKHGSGILYGRARCFVVVSDGIRARPGPGWPQQPAAKCSEKSGDVVCHAPGRLPDPGGGTIEAVRRSRFSNGKHQAASFAGRPRRMLRAARIQLSGKRSMSSAMAGTPKSEISYSTGL